MECHELQGGYCLIGGTCYLDGAQNPANLCQVCETINSSISWTDDDSNECDDGLYCNGWDFCQGGNCQNGSLPCFDDGLDCTVTCVEDPLECNVPDAGRCLIDMMCYWEGDLNPMNPCEECVSSDDQYWWTPDDTNTCPGGVCIMGSCCYPMCMDMCCGDDGCYGECPDNCMLPETCNTDMCECESSYTLTVDAYDDAILLDSSVAAYTNLTEDMYEVSCSSYDAMYATDSTYSQVYISCSGGQQYILDLGGSPIQISGCQNTGVYAFFTDTGTLSDNSGAAHLEFTPTGGSPDGGMDVVYLDVSAVSDTILLDGSEAAYISLPDDSYWVGILDNTAEYEQSMYYSSVYVSCEGYNMFLIDLMMGDWVWGCQSSGLYAFFTDTGDLSDNSGSATLEFSQMDQR
jgi:hypothetical protein